MAQKRRARLQILPVSCEWLFRRWAPVLIPARRARAPALVRAYLETRHASVVQRITQAVERYDTPHERLLAVFEGRRAGNPASP